MEIFGGNYWSERACSCFAMTQCDMVCPQGQDLDPRLSCGCVDQSIIDALFTCDPIEIVDPLEPVPNPLSP